MHKRTIKKLGKLAGVGPENEVVLLDCLASHTLCRKRV